MAPEVLCRQNHGFSVDFYALGVILYELIMKKRPYIVNDLFMAFFPITAILAVLKNTV